MNPKKEDSPFLNKDFLEEEYVKNKLSVSSIIKKYEIEDISVSTITNYLRRYNIYREPLRKGAAKLNKEYLEENYVVLEKSTIDIANEVNCAYGTVLKCLKKYEIPFRNDRVISEEFKDASFKKRFTGFGGISGYYMYALRSNSRLRKQEMSVSSEFLWNLFLKQDGKCAISGVEITLPPVNTKCDRKMFTASVDRKDSDIGYTPENVQWVHKIVNKIKNKFSDEEFINWCKIIADYNRSI